MAPDVERQLYTTFLASSFRTLRFGINEAHGKGMALQFNYLTDKGAFNIRNGRFAVDVPNAKTAVRDLAHELLTIEATGDYARAKKMLTSWRFCVLISGPLWMGCEIFRPTSILLR